MNTDEQFAALRAKLRDIHVPTEGLPPESVQFALWPIVTFLALLGLLYAWRYWKRNAWRRHMRAVLRRIETEPDLSTRWRNQLAAARDIGRFSGRNLSLPPAAYCDPIGVTEADADALGVLLRTEVAR